VTVLDHGAGVIVLAVFLPLSQWLGGFGAKVDNKFLLSVHLVLEIGALLSGLGLAGGLFGRAAPTENLSAVEACLLRGEGADSSSMCASYIRSDRYAGFQAAWGGLFREAHSDSDSYARIVSIEKAGDCCGFGPVLGCQEDSRQMPDYILLDGVPKQVRVQRQSCGEEAFWYPQSGKDTLECAQSASDSRRLLPPTTVAASADDDGSGDSDASLTDVGGCKYEMPASNCKSDAAPAASTKGCAVQLEKEMNYEMRAFGGVIMGFTLLQVVSITSTWFLCWKRKAHDVVPDLSASSFQSSALPLTSSTAAVRDPYLRRQDPGFRPTMGSDEAHQKFTLRQGILLLRQAQHQQEQEEEEQEEAALSEAERGRN